MSKEKLKRWDDPENGTWEVKMIQCKKCIYNEKNPMKCVKYPDRKPNFVLKCEQECPYFELNT